MHFKIIKLEEKDTPKKEFATELDYNDACLNAHTDYYGDLHSSQERKSVINSDWFKNMFDGFATVDTKKETITFLDKDTVTRNFKEYLKELTKKLAKKAEEETLLASEIYFAASEYKGNPTLFYIGYGITSFDLMDDARFFAGKTFKIGNIFDAHF